jgi:hypothetical protein
LGTAIGAITRFANEFALRGRDGWGQRFRAALRAFRERREINA